MIIINYIQQRYYIQSYDHSNIESLIELDKQL